MEQIHLICECSLLIFRQNCFLNTLMWVPRLPYPLVWPLALPKLSRSIEVKHIVSWRPDILAIYVYYVLCGECDVFHPGSMEPKNFKCKKIIMLVGFRTFRKQYHSVPVYMLYIYVETYYELFLLVR